MMIDPNLLDIKGRLNSFFPEFAQLLDGNYLDWAKVNECFARKGNQYYKQYELTNETFRIEASIFNIITGSIKGEADAQRMFGFIRNLFIELINSTTKDEREEIVPALYGMLTNVDMKYQNFLGELAVLNLLKSQMPLTLIQTERPLLLNDPKGTKIDFNFVDRESKKEWLVEVVNFRVFEKDIASDKDTKKLLRYKIKRKLLRTGITKSKAFMLVPVAWGTWDKIKKLADYYEGNNPQFENTTIPVSFIPFSDPSGKSVYRFDAIDTVFRNSTAI